MSLTGREGEADRVTHKPVSLLPCSCVWSFRKSPRLLKYTIRGWQDRGWAWSAGVSRDFDTVGLKELTVLVTFSGS